MNIEKCIQEIKTNLHNWITDNGFVMEGQEFGFYRKESESITDYLDFSVGDNEDKIFAYIVIFSRRINLIESFWEEYRFEPLSITGGIPSTIGGDYNSGFLKNTSGDSKIANWANWEEEGSGLVEKLCNKVKSDYYTIILPKLNEYSDIRKLNDIANGDDRTFSLGNEKIFRRLIISKLAGNANYETMYLELQQRFIKGIEQNPENQTYKDFLFVIEQIHEKMKNIEPLGNTILV